MDRWCARIAYSRINLTGVGTTGAFSRPALYLNLAARRSSCAVPSIVTSKIGAS